jgi:predicted DNA-binding protein
VGEKKKNKSDLKSKLVAIRLTDELYKNASILAKNESLCVATFIRVALDKYVKSILKGK